MTITILLATALLAAAPPEPDPKAAFAPKPSEQANLATYNGLRARSPDTADGHWKLGLWCERKGLTAEAMVEFADVVRLDPRRDSAWKKLGYEKRDGRWMTTKQAADERADLALQKKADAHWRPLLTKWKAWLDQKSKRAEAQALLVRLDDPRAVPSVWHVFATGTPDDQERAIDIFGHIEGVRATRALAGLAVFGKTDLVRRAAVDTLIGRPHDEVLMNWIGLLAKPVKYEVRQVAGPGSTGVLLIEGRQFNARRVYNTPSIDQTQASFVDLSMERPVLPMQFNSSPPEPPPGSRCVGARGRTRLYVFDYTWAIPPPPKKGPDPTSAYQHFESNEVQAEADLNFEITESMKMAAGAQGKLEQDVAAIEEGNAQTRETNERIAESLRRVSGKDLGVDREAWLKWYLEKRGYTYKPPKGEPRSTVDVQVPLPYVPKQGPALITQGGGSGGTDWCMIWEHKKGQKPTTSECFGSGTVVSTPSGPRPIESLRAGELVVNGPDPSRARVIVSVHRSRAVATLRLTVDGDPIVTTAGHPFFKVGAGWARAGDLSPGDLLLTRRGPATVEAVVPGLGQAVWNLRVEGGEFRVGSRGITVHDVSPIGGAFATPSGER